jgi:hypothetical protein
MLGGSNNYQMESNSAHGIGAFLDNHSALLNRLCSVSSAHSDCDFGRDYHRGIMAFQNEKTRFHA